MDEAEWPLNVKGEGEAMGEGEGTRRWGRWGRWRRLAARRVPALRWLPQYGAEAALADAVAGASLGLTLVPQSIAYAALADLPPQYGLYSSFVGTVVYAALGAVKEVSIGPTSLMALLTLQACRGLPVAYVTLLAFLSGCVVLLMAALRLGFVVELVAPAVTSGFTSATAVIIVVAQLKGLLGLAFVADSVPHNLALLWAHAGAGEVRPGDCALAALCCPALLLLRKLKDVRVSAKRPRLRKALWVVSIARNALVVLAGALAAYCTRAPPPAPGVAPAAPAAPAAHPYFKLSGRVKGGLPPLALPAFSSGAAGAADMAQRLGGSLLLVPCVMVLANIAIAKAYSAGGRVDATQEMVALGLANVLGSLVGSMPTCGAFTRSAVAASSGVRSPLAGLYSGCIALLALLFLTDYFYYIPKATLSSVLVCAVVFMIDYQAVFRLWRTDRGELAVLAVTFAVSLALSVEVALVAGAACSLARLLRRIMRPPLALCCRQTRLGPAVVARGVSALVYASAEHVCARLARAAAVPAPAPGGPAPTPGGAAGGPAPATAPRLLLLDCAQLAALDLPAVEALDLLGEKLRARDQQLVVFNATPRMARKLARLQAVERACFTAASVDEALACLARAPAPTPAPAGAVPAKDEAPV